MNVVLLASQSRITRFRLFPQLLDVIGLLRDSIIKRVYLMPVSIDLLLGLLVRLQGLFEFLTFRICLSLIVSVFVFEVLVHAEDSVLKLGGHVEEVFVAFVFHFFAMGFVVAFGFFVFFLFFFIHLGYDIAEFFLL